jgi:CRP/FNR family transcriptional regulator, cyclic AMP receptor protein
MAQTKPCQALMDIENVLAILNDISIFAGLTDKHLYSLFKLLQKLTFAPNEIIFAQGDKPSYIYIVEKGNVKITVSENDTTLELVTFKQGCCFGEASVIGIQPHKGTAIAIEKTELIVLSRQALMSIYDSDKEMFSILIMNIAREVCRRLHATEDVILHYFAQKHPMEH